LFHLLDETIRDIGAVEAFGDIGQVVVIEIGGNREILQFHFEELNSGFFIREVHPVMGAKAARS
jgi:hypothetical protein